MGLLGTVDGVDVLGSRSRVWHVAAAVQSAVCGAAVSNSADYRLPHMQGAPETLSVS